MAAPDPGGGGPPAPAGGAGTAAAALGAGAGPGRANPAATGRPERAPDAAAFAASLRRAGRTFADVLAAPPVADAGPAAADVPAAAAAAAEAPAAAAAAAAARRTPRGPGTRMPGF
ncbi:hypothetical protein DIPPA_30980 [Diplonema papillatum]|nr:hypothetical protein DIPPA_27262 [Diplonema papillatum]KAJ9442187.1 hypothetical protein DIPPA_30980 [Diplonema papillatum]